MTDAFVAVPSRLIAAAIIGIVLLLLLIIKGKLQPLVAILISAIGIGFIAGMPLNMITDTITKGIGKTLEGIALLVGLGSMFGAILEKAPTCTVDLSQSFSPLIKPNCSLYRRNLGL